MAEHIELYVAEETDRFKGLHIHERQSLSHVARFALDLIRAGSAPAVPDGETSTGFPKYRVYTPEELVDRSMQIAELTFAALEQRRWSLEAPPIEELKNDTSVPAGFGST